MRPLLVKCGRSALIAGVWIGVESLINGSYVVIMIVQCLFLFLFTANIIKNFLDYVNMVLEDVVEYETTGEGKRVTKLDTILLNGNHITMLVPGGEGPEI